MNKVLPKLGFEYCYMSQQETKNSAGSVNPIQEHDLWGTSPSLNLRNAMNCVKSRAVGLWVVLRVRFPGIKSSSTSQAC